MMFPIGHKRRDIVSISKARHIISLVIIINVQREHEERGKGGGFDDQICGHLSPPTPLVAEEENKKKETKRQSRRMSNEDPETTLMGV